MFQQQLLLVITFHWQSETSVIFLVFPEIIPALQLLLFLVLSELCHLSKSISVIYIRCRFFFVFFLLILVETRQYHTRYWWCLCYDTRFTLVVETDNLLLLLIFKFCDLPQTGSVCSCKKLYIIIHDISDWFYSRGGGSGDSQFNGAPIHGYLVVLG